MTSSLSGPMSTSGSLAQPSVSAEDMLLAPVVQPETPFSRQPHSPPDVRGTWLDAYAGNAYFQERTEANDDRLFNADDNGLYRHCVG